MTWRHRVGLVVAVSVVGLTAFAASRGVVQAATNSDEAPHPGNSTPGDAHTFLLRKSSDWGANPDVRFIAYYPKGMNNTTWGNAYLKLRPGGKLTDPLVCQSEGGGGSNKPRYITVTLTREDTGDTYNYRIPYDNACNYADPDHTNENGENDRNQLFGRYYLPGSNSAPDDDNVNQTTNRHHVYVTIRYHDSVPPNQQNTGNTAQFDVKGNTTGLKIGQLGGGEAENDTTDGYSFPLRPDYAHVRDYPNSSSAVDIPFGLPCNIVGSDLKEKRIGIFDADNGALPFQPYRVQFRVKEVGGDYVKFVNGTEKRAEIRDNGYVLRPWDGEAAYASAKIKMKTQTSYVMEITGIANGNIIDVHVPGDTIYGDIDCKWEIRPDSTVDVNVQEPNGWVNFTHTATNIKGFKSAPVTSEVMWGKQGVKTTGTISTDTDRIYNPNNNTGSKTFTNSFRIPAAAQEGDEYCQYLKVKPHSYNDSTAYDSWQKGDRACVTVQLAPEIPQRQVNIQPVVNGLMEYVEPTETAKFDGYVNISGFPLLWSDEWGYTEVAKQRPAQRVTATSSSGLEVDGPFFTTPTTTYTCPHTQDTKQGTGASTQCKHARNGPANDTKAECEANGWTWSSGSCYNMHDPTVTTECPATYQPLSSSSCWRYRYKCTYDSTWGAWNAPAPSCMSYWTCPGGAAGSGWYDSAPNCQGWRCQYAPYTQVNQPTAPPCEYRCSDGTGLRAPQSNGWTGDMNCYIAPSFTLTCYWKNKPAFSQTVTGNGKYCDNRDMDADEVGITIGTAVRAILTANYPGVNAWSSPPPGYKINTLETSWGWDNFPSRSAEDTVRVVGKPTVKIRGGDVAAGGQFKTINTCNLTPTFSTIGGWPHMPVYDAAGTEFATTASGNVTGFATATLQANRSAPPYALAFANTPRPSGDQFGRQFTSRMPCIYDHYGMKPATMPSLDLATGINGAQNGSYTGTGGVIRNNPMLQKGQRVTVYVDGNVYIRDGGVRYNRSAPWATTQDIPGFKLVVRGNIYIDPSVTELNGIYVAQPTSPTSTTTGNIYTCATSTARVTTGDLYNNCRTNTLTVNGVFLARKVYLDRTQGTAIRGETAEYFNYLPELWLTNWETTDSSNELKYDSIISLPPVL